MRVEAALASVEGVKEAEVSFADNTAKVTFAKGKVEVEELLFAVEEATFVAIVVQ